MKISRKQFLKSGVLITGGIMLSGHKFFSQFEDQPKGFKVIRGNFGIYSERGGTMGWYVTKDSVIVIDSQFADSAKNFHNGLKSKTANKIDFLFNTHHHRDHTSGNHYLREFTNKIVSSENCRALQEKFNGNNPDNPQAYADITFADDWTLDIGGEKIFAKHFCPAHTGGDAIMHFEKTNVVHMGDLVFNKVYPVIDLPGGASLSGWIDFLEYAVKYFDKDTIYIFGHAQNPEMVVGSDKDLLAMRNYITALLDFVGKEIKNGRTKEEITSSLQIPGVTDVKEMWQGAMKRNLENAFDYLTTNKL